MKPPIGNLATNVWLHGQVKQLVSYQCEVDKDKLTTIASFEKLMFQARALDQSKGLALETPAFQNSLQWLIYPYQLHVDN